MAEIASHTGRIFSAPPSSFGAPSAIAFLAFLSGRSRESRLREWLADRMPTGTRPGVLAGERIGGPESRNCRTLVHLKVEIATARHLLSEEGGHSLVRRWEEGEFPVLGALFSTKRA